MITLFEEFENKPNLNSVSKDFWDMVRIANWSSVIDGYKNNPSINNLHRSFFEDAQGRIFLKYSYSQIKQFENEYDNIYYQLYDYFKSTWLDDKYNKFMPSDDGYSDLLSSIIGKGKYFVQKCINNTDFFVRMAESDDYVENFQYLFMVNEEEYKKLKFDYMGKSYNL